MKNSSFPIVSAILVRDGKNGMEILLQKRWKPKNSPAYLGLWEIPAGTIESFENIYVALAREVKEETNLDVVEIVGDYHSTHIDHKNGDQCFVFKPFICQQMLKTDSGLPWIGFVFLCRVGGILQAQSNETRDPEWVQLGELRTRINEKPGMFFSLQLPVLKYFLTTVN